MNVPLRINPKKTKKLIPIGIFLLLGVVFSISTVYTIETGSVGVLARFGKYRLDEVMPGLHFKIPLVDAVKKVDVKVRTLNYVGKRGVARVKPGEVVGSGEGILYGSPISVLDQRGLTVGVELTVQYQLRPRMAAEVLSEYGENYEMKLIHPIVRDAVRDVIAQYPAELLPMKRNEIAEKIRHMILSQVEKIRGNPLQVTAVQLRNIILPARIAQKIQEVQEAKQEAEKMKALEEKAQREQRVRIIQAETEKKEKILRAEAEKQERILRAQAEAEARLLRAKAEAGANKRIAQSLTPNILRWRELAVQEKMAEAIEKNPNVRLFYGNVPGNMHFWMGEQSQNIKNH